MLLIALTVLHYCEMCVYFGLVVLGLSLILIRAGQHWFSGSLMKTCIP